MKPYLTDITLVIDRSGSMASIRDDAEGGVNAFIEDQSQQPGEALLTLVQFDTEYECLHKGVPIRQVPQYQLQPRGSTALLDAIGRAMNETGSRLAHWNEEDRPGLVILVVMTDGQENSSVEFSLAAIKQMIEHQQQVYNWHFTFLGANQDAFAEAGAMGIQAAAAANWSSHKATETMMATGAKVARMRRQRQAGDIVLNEFTDEERKRMV